MLEANQDKINWDILSLNPSAIHLLEDNPDNIYWPWLSLNPAAIHLLEQNQDKISWSNLSQNPGIFIPKDDIKEALQSIRINNDWNIISFIPTYELANWIPADKINWKSLLQNPAAIHLLKENQDSLDKESWLYLSRNYHQAGLQNRK